MPHITDDLSTLLGILPPLMHVRIEALLTERGLTHHDLLEIALDLDRYPEVRTTAGSSRLKKEGDKLVDAKLLEEITSQLSPFGDDNRAGIPGTLHRISALRNRRGSVVGLTLRVGRAVYGTAECLRDFITSGASILILGNPGSGKTTKLRDAARLLADELDKRVVIVDTSNEIAGDGDVPHAAIGNARRMQVPQVDKQHAVMIEAVENHMPEVIVIDEIGNEQEAHASRTIAERGVQLIATAHGLTLDNLLQNPSMNDLIGGVATVTLGDKTMRERGLNQKTVPERKLPPTFTVIVELLDRNTMVIHPDVAAAVDALLAGKRPTATMRTIDDEGQVLDSKPVNAEVPSFPYGGMGNQDYKTVKRGKRAKVFLYGISYDRFEAAAEGLELETTKQIGDATHLLVSERMAMRDANFVGKARSRGLQVITVNANSRRQLTAAARDLGHTL